MTAAARVPGATLTGIRGGLLKLAIRRKLGNVPESVEVLSNHPAVFMDTVRAGAKVERWDRLDRTLGSLAIMAAAAQIGCSFCLDLNYFLAHDEGLDADTVREVLWWRESELFSPPERRVLEYAEAMCQTPPTVSDELSAALLADLGAAGLVELTYRIGFMNLSARSNVALGIRSEHFSDSCALPPLPSRATLRADGERA